MDFIKSELFLVALTFLVFFGAKQLQLRFKLSIFQPILITIAVLILFLKCTGLEYSDYEPTGHVIEFWLKPAIVALGLPLYNQMKNIRQLLVPILISQFLGCIVGIVSVVGIMLCFGTPSDVILSLVPKSVSTPIAIEISSKIGGIPSLTAAIVVLVGLIGSMFGFKILSVGHIFSPVARGISMGTAAHVMGTNRASEVSERYGAYATVGLIINGIFTAVLAQPIVSIFGLH